MSAIYLHREIVNSIGHKPSIIIREKNQVCPQISTRATNNLFISNGHISILYLNTNQVQCTRDIIVQF